MQTADTKPLDALEVWKSISKSWKILSKEAEKALDKTGLSLAEVRILYALREKGPLPITKLTSEIIVTPGAVTSLIDGLEVHKHLVERVRSNEDRRVVNIKITSIGEDELEKTLLVYRKFVRRIFDKFSKKEMIVLFDLMQKLSGASQD